MKLSRIFLSHLVLLLAALFLFISIFSYYTFKNIEISNYADALKKEAALLESIIERDGISDALVRKLDKKIDARITVIDPKGRVIAESRHDKEDMENHLLRPEVQAALHTGWGQSVRYSTTLHKDFLYVAKRSGAYILRLAYPLGQIRSSYMRLWLQFVALFALFVVAAMAASFMLSAKISRQIEAIVEYLDALAHKKFDRPLKVGFAKEFVTIGEHLKALAAKLAKREAKKEKFTKKIKQISRQRNELISAISHEFKNPVAIITGYTETLLDDPDMPSPLRRRFLQKIHNAGSKITAMIDRLALAMKFESGNLTLQKSRFDLCEAARDVVELLRSRYKNREIHLSCEPSFVEADRAMIEIAMSNLLDNALKYSELDVAVEVRGGRFCVRDKGVGIKEEDLNRITQKFYRVRHSWDNSMGLGLYITSYILKLHGSELEIESRYKEGSQFCFRLEEV